MGRENFDDHWDLSEFNDADFTCTISNIHFVAIRNNDNTTSATGRRANRWNIFLQTSADSCIMLDMIPGSSPLHGSLKVGSKGSIYTDEQIKVISSTIRGINVTLNDIANLIVACGRHKYKFNDNAEGCRHWVTIVAHDLEEACYIFPGVSAEVKEAASTYWIDPDGSEPCPIAEGTFLA
jgi:hypothetical protein